jgi:putative transcriptional regulator
MKCALCAGEMVRRRENYRYDASGLRRLTLVGVEVARCPSCGEHEVVIPAIEDLHHAIARALVTQAGRLRHDEVRFLRKHLGLSGVDFAKLIDVTPETVSRWERGALRMSVMAERLLRALVLTQGPVVDYTLGRLAESGLRGGATPPLRLRMARGAWSPVAA